MHKTFTLKMVVYARFLGARTNERTVVLWSVGRSGRTFSCAVSRVVSARASIPPLVHTAGSTVFLFITQLIYVQLKYFPVRKVTGVLKTCFFH